MSSPPPAGEPRRFSLRWFLRPVTHAFAVVGFIGFLYHGAFHLSVIASGSMGPTLRGDSLKNGDVVLSERITYKLRNPRRWEIIMYREPEQQMQVMKRVVGLPGETLEFNQDTQSFSANGAPVTRPASIQSLKYLAYGTLAPGKKAECGDGFFVLGDDSKDSLDSRWVRPIKPSEIRARPWLVIWPLSHFRFVNP